VTEAESRLRRVESIRRISIPKWVDSAGIRHCNDFLLFSSVEFEFSFVYVNTLKRGVVQSFQRLTRIAIPQNSSKQGYPGWQSGRFRKIIGVFVCWSPKTRRKHIQPNQLRMRLLGKRGG
jgi:hypothetical protein